MLSNARIIQQRALLFCLISLGVHFDVHLGVHELEQRVSQAHAHAWRGQAVVLFVTYEIRDRELRGTLGLPSALLLREIPSRPATLNALLRQETGYAELVSALGVALRRDLPILIDQRERKPQLTRIDLIRSLQRPRGQQALGRLRNKSSALIPPSSLSEERDLRVVDGVNVETHQGRPEAAVINFTIPLTHEPREVSFLWKSERWFMREGRRARRGRRVHKGSKSGALSTRKVAGIIIDRAQITPISFTPVEPEVVWRSPKAFQPPRAQKNSGQRLGHLEKPTPVNSPNTSIQELSESSIKFHALHAQIYEAFQHQADVDIYDALSEALAGRALDEVFSSTYRALILRDEGGARARVTHLIPLSHRPLSNENATPKLRSHLAKLNEQRQAFYLARHEWRVAGEVTHWGHTHRRVHDYEAIYVMSEGPSGWRITFTMPLRQTRRPELEGGL